METSLSYGGDSKSLRIRAKEKIHITTNSTCQLHGELDTKFGNFTFLNGMIRHFNPDLSASIGVGVQYNKQDKVHYNIRGKKTFPVTADGLINFSVKGRCNFNEEFRKIDYAGATELVWNIFNFKKDQDLRLKLGYDITVKTPYLQIRENNWTFNFDGDRRWNVRYDL